MSNEKKHELATSNIYKNKQLLRNKAGVLACEAGKLPTHLKNELWRRIGLESSIGVGLGGTLITTLVLWQVFGFFQILGVLFVIGLFSYSIRQRVLMLLNPDITYVEGPVSKLEKPDRVVCQGQELYVSLPEVWAEIDTSEMYRLWYSTKDSKKRLAAFELLHTKTMKRDETHQTWLAWSNAQKAYQKTKEGIPFVPVNEKNYVMPYKQLTALPPSKAQQVNPNGLDTFIKSTASDNLSERLIAYRAILSLGGEAVETLQTVARNKDSIQQASALWLLESIAQETTQRLSNALSQVLCSRCLTRCKGHHIKLSWSKSITYYGCRVCGQSREILTAPTVIAVLDVDMLDKQSQTEQTLRINWFERGRLFDFDAVEIINASDEDVERFVVHVGNDTDKFRKPRYGQVSCRVASSCSLSENSKRILKKMFERQ